MKNIDFKMKTLIAGVFFCVSSSSSFSQIKLTVSNIGTLKGNLRIGIYTSQKSFDADKPAYNNDVSFRGMQVRVSRSTMVIEIDDLPKGDYLIAVFHDINENKLFDSNLLGIPLEPYGFSNNARSAFGPPSFEKAKITYAGLPMALDITIK